MWTNGQVFGRLGQANSGILHHHLSPHMSKGIPRDQVCYPILRICSFVNCFHCFPLNFIAEACRKKVINYLSSKFTTPSDANVAYFPAGSTNPWCIQSSMMSHHDVEVPQTVEEAVSSIQHLLSRFDSTIQLQIISSIYQTYALNSMEVLIPMDYIQLSIAAMNNLKHAGRSNVLYKFSKAVVTLRDDGTDTLLPVKRLPLALIEYCVNFYTATSVVKVS